LAACGADAIHRRVAAADDDDAAILGVELARGEVRHFVAQANAVGGDEEIQRWDQPRITA
jgi:hypothetical protein